MLYAWLQPHVCFTVHCRLCVGMWVVKLATPSPPPSCLICTLSIPRRQVCRRLQRVIDSDNHAQLWSRASLDMVWVAPSNRAIMERLVAPLSLSRLPTHRLLSSCCRRAAQRGNVEALIKLAVAYLYSEGGQFEINQTLF